MDPFRIYIAGLCAQVQPMFLSTREYCKAYLTEQEPELFVTVTPEDLAYEQRMADIEADEEGLKRRTFTDPFLERASIQRKIADALLQRNVIMTHGSTVGVDGEAFLFTAACGTGKSTHTRFWREMFGSRAVMINDDKPFLEIREDGVIAHGSPWSGKHGLDTNVSMPLKGICILHRGPENVIRPLKPRAFVVSIGHNDRGFGYTPDEVVTNLAKLFEFARADFPGIKIYACDCRPTLKFVTNYHLEYMDTFHQLLKEYCQSHEDTVFVDHIHHPIWFENPEDVGDHRKVRRDIYVEDDVHFNQLGYDLYTEYMKEILKDVL